MNILQIDEELKFLELSLNAIEPIFKLKNDEIKKSIQEEGALLPELCEQAEFIAGLGFTIYQKIYHWNLGWIKVDKRIRT